MEQPKPEYQDASSVVVERAEALIATSQYHLPK